MQEGYAKPEQLTQLFHELFAASFGTCLCFGDSDPEYVPSPGPGEPHRIFFAHGFFASALHEVAHWCVAGPDRRLLPDYGYWYRPDGRSTVEQQEFSQVEVKPQALEWIFSTAAGVAFHFSADNLTAGGAVVSAEWQAFQASVLDQVHTYLRRGLPARAQRFASGLAELYGTGGHWAVPEAYALG